MLLCCRPVLKEPQGSVETLRADVGQGGPRREGCARIRASGKRIDCKKEINRLELDGFVVGRLSDGWLRIEKVYCMWE